MTGAGRIRVRYGAAARAIRAALRLAGSGAVWVGLAVVVAMALGASGGAHAEIEAAHASPGADVAGEGPRALDGTLWLGGDVTMVGALFERAPSSFEFDDMNLLVRYEPHPRLAFFSEIRLEDTFAITEEDGVEENTHVAIERLYVDWLVAPGLTLRAGKFLTPFGLWNVVRRAPLTWTVERPLVTDLAFPEHTTGVGVLYQTTLQGWSLDGVAYGPAQDELSFRPTEEDARLLAGGRVAAGHALGPAFVTVGLNGAAAEGADSRHMRAIYGADTEVSVAGHQVMFEVASAQSSGRGQADLWGLYVQDAIPLVETVWGVVRFEHFTSAEGVASDGGLIGVAWRPWRHLIVKVNYQFASREQEDLQRGLLASVALFF